VRRIRGCWRIAQQRLRRTAYADGRVCCRSARSSTGLFIGVVMAIAALLPTSSAWAHDVSPAEMARMHAVVMSYLNSGWFGIGLLILSGVGLGALHGLEPGHSKTMMSAFIIAIRGTIGQAALLGAAATISHTAIVWLLVVPVMFWGRTIDLARNEPYFQIAAAMAVLAIGSWSAMRIWLARDPRHAHDRHGEELSDSSSAEPIDTGHGLARLEIVEVDGAPRFRVQGVARSGRPIPFVETVEVRTRETDGSSRTYAFEDQGEFQQSLDTLPADNGFAATLRVLHDDHAHEFPVSFGMPVETQPRPAYADAHERAHAEDLQRRLREGPISKAQIILFGLSGGLLPCPAAVTVLLLCLQLKRLGLGMILVTSFSIGLALTMIAVGSIAAIGARHLSSRWSGLSAAAPHAAALSCALILCIGLYMLIEGLSTLA
jgi:nickel/cobalt transporter (NicO) family protein